MASVQEQSVLNGMRVLSDIKDFDVYKNPK